MKILKSRWIQVTAMLFIAYALIGCDSNSDSIYRSGARTHSAAINLNSPASTGQAFISAWRSSDYATFSFLLSFDAKEEFISAYQRFDVKSIVPNIDKEIEFFEAVDENFPDKDFRETFTDASILIDAILITAEQQDLLPFALRANASIKSIDQSEGLARVVITTGDNTVKEIALILVQMERSSRWKIEQIEIPGFKARTEFW